MFRELEIIIKRGTTMKQLIRITVMFLALLVGCSKDVDINTPIQNQTSDEYVTRIEVDGTLYKGSSSKNTPVLKAYTVSKEIDGSKGGIITYGNYEQAKSGTTAHVYAACYFPAGAFSGKKTITMSLDTKTCVGTFSPAMTFDKPVSFSALYSGVNLSKYDASNISFVYFGANNEMTIIPSSYLYIDKDRGVLGILNAQLPHFSRYGFLR